MEDATRRLRWLGPAIILIGGIAIAAAPFIPYTLDDGTNGYIQARRQVQFAGHRDEFYPAILGVVIAGLAVISLMTLNWPGWRSVFTFAAAMVSVETLLAFLVTRTVVEQQPSARDPVTQAITALAVGTGLVIVGTIWMRRTTREGDRIEQTSALATDSRS